MAGELLRINWRPKMTDREYFPPNNLPDWLKDFADKELKQAGGPFEEIKNIFKQKDDLDSVEAKVEELRKRIGLDQIDKTAGEKVKGGFGDNKSDKDFDPEQLNKGIKIELEHTDDPEVAKEITKDHLTESKDFKGGKGGKYYDKLEKLEDEYKEELTDKEQVKAKLILNLLSIAEQFKYNIKIAKLIEEKIQKIAKKSVFEKHEGIKKHIDNICESRKGHIEAPALLDMIKSRPEKLTESDVDEVKEYIKKKIEETKEDVDFSRDDDKIGLVEVHLFTVKEDDGNREMYDKPAKI